MRIYKVYSFRDKIKRIKPISSILSYMSPVYSRCEKCGLPWNHCNSKSVNYDIHSETFATCDYCWDHSTLEQLKTYYTTVYRKQEKSLLSYGYKMDHTLKQLLGAVEIEYYKDFSDCEKLNDIRKRKFKNIKNYDKKNHK